MPRTKWVSKCSYCRGCKLSDPVFEKILWCWLKGNSAVDALAFVQQECGSNSVRSEKTIGRIYRRIGSELKTEFLEPMFDKTYPDFGKLKHTDRAMYEKRKRELHALLHYSWTKGIVMDEWWPGGKCIVPYSKTDLVAMYRQLSATKRGLVGSVAENLALTYLRFLFKKDHSYASSDMSDDEFAAMFEFMKENLRKTPC